MNFSLFQGDCIEVMRGLPDNSVDSVCTDPPYGLKFMGHRWDCDVPSVDVWREVFRVLKPGGHLLSFSGTRTYHRMVVNIEDAGFEIRDQIMWVYGSGFPKSQDVSKAIDKQAGAERRVVGVKPGHEEFAGRTTTGHLDFKDATDGFDRPWMHDDAKRAAYHMQTAPATPEAEQWQGWGTALKPAFEPLCLAQKPLDTKTEQGTIISNLLTLERKLWSLLLANAAEKNSTSSRNELSAACAIAQWSVEEATNTRVRLCAAMDMSQFESAINTSLSIVSSWRRTLAESLKHGNTSTTETKSSTTTDWTILRFCLSQITPYTITTGLSPQHGQIVFASPAEQYFDAALKMLNATLELSALASVISQDRQSSLAVGGNVSSEPICVARKPLSAKTVAANVILHGTGAINIDACRVELQGESDAAEFENNHRVTERLPESYDGELLGLHDGGWKQRVGAAVIPTGRWPANLMHDGSDEVISAFPDSKGQQGDLKGHSKSRKSPNGCFGEMAAAAAADHPARNDSGSAARFFYSSKASKKDRNSGCEGVLSWENVDLSEQIQSVLSHLKGTSEIITALQVDCECGMTWFGSNTSEQYLTVTMFIIETVSKLITELTTLNFCQSSITRESILVAIRMLREHGLNLVESAENISLSIANTTSEKTGSALGAVIVLLKTLSEISEKGRQGNVHSTVKPTDVCRWLLRLVTPPGGTSLDLYCGSGSFGKAAILEGFNWIGIDRDRDEEGNSLGYLDIARARCLDAQCEASGL